VATDMRLSRRTTKSAGIWKFLLGRDGTVVARFRSHVAPEAAQLIESMERELAKPVA
jgi:glutathione peroxidase-family protein